MLKKFIFALLATATTFFAASAAEKSVRQLRFVQDDAQDYMVSKIYQLKYVQANDVTPFLLGMVMRYNTNSSVGNIECGPGNRQLLTVTCPVELMPYVDDFIAKIDRNITIDGKVPGDIIRGTGITREVYQPHYRSGQNLLNVLVNSVIGAGVYSSVYAWDANSNQIYWKDNSSNSSFTQQFLAYLDRPSPQITLTFTLYEVRESTLRDMGIEYLAWKNGPGLDIAQVGWKVFDITSAGTAAIQAATGPVGGFLFAPQFDASFIRLLAQSGDAEIRSTASLTVANSETESYSITFNPGYQNIIKSDNDQSSVVTSSISQNPTSQLALQITSPIANIHYGASQAGYPSSEGFEVSNYTPGDYTKYPGTLFFSYNLQSANVVEENNLGSELIESATVSGSALIDFETETILAQWDENQEIEQTIGVPFLMDIPILKYLFSTTTTSTEKCKIVLSVKVEALNTKAPADLVSGKLAQINSKGK